jgi:hypothetical protein
VNLLGIRALPNLGLGGYNFDNYTNVAVFRYQGAPNQNPPDPSQNVPVLQNQLLETNLHVSLTVSLSDLFIDEVAAFSSV